MSDIKANDNELLVSKLQARLQQRGAKIDVDGWGGTSTLKALDQYFPDRAPAPKALVGSSKLGLAMIEIARGFVGKKEIGGNNQGEWIKPFWVETTYRSGYAEKQPYCAAALAYCLAKAGRQLHLDQKLAEATGMTLAQFESWRCKSARAYEWDALWAKSKKLTVFNDQTIPSPGDLMVFDISHIGLVVSAKGSMVSTIEFNTGPGGGRDGDGCWAKERPRSIARAFIRLP